VGGSAGVGGSGGASGAAGSGGSAGAQDSGASGAAGNVERPDAGGRTDAGGDDGGSHGALQMNDVSVLFPLEAAGLAADSYLKPSSLGAGGELLPSKLYDAIGVISGSTPVSGGGVGGPAQALYADLRVVALRLDPCFAALQPDPHGAGCTNQLRLVMQEVKNDGGKASAFDSAIHLFYSLSRQQLVDASQSIARLRRAARGSDEHLGALAPHAVIKQQGMAGSMAAGLRDLILHYAGQQNLTRATTMSSTNSGFQWTFAGFDISNAAMAAMTKMVIPTLPMSATQQLFFRGFGNKVIEGQFMPTTSSADDLTIFASAQKSGAARPAVESAFAALIKIEDPSKHSPDTIDCASCHLASPFAALVALPNFSLDEDKDPNAFKPSGGSVSAGEMSSTFDRVSLLNLHAFSYVGANPSINRRVVNETAAIVEYLNHL
jgi:hypothetical protein